MPSYPPASPRIPLDEVATSALVLDRARGDLVNRRQTDALPFLEVG